MTSCGLQVVMDLAFAHVFHVPVSVNGSCKFSEELLLPKHKALNDSISSGSVISITKAPHVTELARDQAC